MRPAMSDSLISGQPLYLLYSNAYFGAPAGAAPFWVDLATQATGSVRLQVTGSPPTVSAFGFFSEHPTRPRGTVAAAKPCASAARRVRRRVFKGPPEQTVTGGSIAGVRGP